MKEFIEANGGVVGTTALVLLCVNMGLSSLAAILEKFKDKTKSEVDNKLHALANSLASKLIWVIDLVSANRQHK